MLTTGQLRTTDLGLWVELGSAWWRNISTCRPWQLDTKVGLIPGLYDNPCYSSSAGTVSLPCKIPELVTCLTLDV